MLFRGEAIPGGKRLIEDMPLTLQQDVTYEESKNVLERVIRLFTTHAFTPSYGKLRPFLGCYNFSATLSFQH